LLDKARAKSVEITEQLYVLLVTSNSMEITKACVIDAGMASASANQGGCHESPISMVRVEKWKKIHMRNISRIALVTSGHLEGYYVGALGLAVARQRGDFVFSPHELMFRETMFRDGLHVSSEPHSFAFDNPVFEPPDESIQNGLLRNARVRLKIDSSLANLDRYNV
jgi:hypothetical protein